MAGCMGTRPGQKAIKSIEKVRLQVFNQHVRRTKAFWNLPCIHALGCAGHGIIMLYIVPLAVQDRDIGLGTAAFTLTIISSVSIISRFVTPILCERQGTKVVMATCLLLQALPVVMLFWADSAWEFFLFSAIFGLGFGGRMDRLPSHQPPVLWQRAHGHPVWLAERRLPDGSRLCQLCGGSDGSHKRVLHCHPDIQLGDELGRGLPWWPPWSPHHIA